MSEFVLGINNDCMRYYENNFILKKYLYGKLYKERFGNSLSEHCTFSIFCQLNSDKDKNNGWKEISLTFFFINHVSGLDLFEDYKKVSQIIEKQWNDFSIVQEKSNLKSTSFSIVIEKQGIKSDFKCSDIRIIRHFCLSFQEMIFGHKLGPYRDINRNQWDPWQDRFRFSDFTFTPKKIELFENDLNNPPVENNSHESALWYGRIKRMINFWLKTDGITFEENQELQESIEVFNGYNVPVETIKSCIIPVTEKWQELREKMVKLII